MTISTIAFVFIIAALGYLLGSIRIKGLGLGTSGVLLVALVFGHFGVEIPSIVKNFGLVIFVGSVGLMAGPVFFRNFKKKVYSHMILGILIVLTGGVITMLLGKLFVVPFDLSIGLFAGAMTSTPGLAAAIEATEMVLKGSAESMASIGYGIAYPFGVVGIVMFVQLYPKIMRTNVAEEAKMLHERLHGQANAQEEDGESKYRVLESSGMLMVAITLAIGILLGSIKVPLPGGMSFSVGTAGGPLFAGLIIGHFRHIGGISTRVPASTLKVLRELGLCMFLLGAGTSAGAGFVNVLKEYGWILFVIGMCITLLPMVLTCIVSRLLLKLDTLTTLGSVCGGMTSTPALGALISSSGTEDVAASYAATYPFALVSKVIFSQIIALLW